MRENPSDEEVVLIITAEEESRIPGLEAEVEKCGGTVLERLQFGSLKIEIEQRRIDDLCGLSGIESIETVQTVGIGGDAGEDIE